MIIFFIILQTLNGEWLVFRLLLSVDKLIYRDSKFKYNNNNNNNNAIYLITIYYYIINNYQHKIKSFYFSINEYYNK